jgi:hypothetical protein
MDLQKVAKRAGSLAFASMLLASCSQELSPSASFGLGANAKGAYQTGKLQMGAGHYGLALQSFRKALLQEPRSVKVLNAVAATYDLLGRFDLSERYYRQALNFDPQSVQTLNNFGYSYFLRGKNEKAKSLFQTAARVNGKNPVVAANMVAAEKAEIAQQVAAASHDRERVARNKSMGAKKTWIVRTGPKTQSLVTKPNQAVLQAVRTHGAEPRVVHTPRPLIEITTTDPSFERVAKRPNTAKVAEIKKIPKPQEATRTVHTPYPVIEVVTEKRLAEVAAPPVSAPRAVSTASIRPSVPVKSTSVSAVAKPSVIAAPAPSTKVVSSQATANIESRRMPVDQGFQFAPMKGEISRGLEIRSYPMLAQSRGGSAPSSTPARASLDDLPKLREEIARDVRKVARNISSSERSAAPAAASVRPAASKTAVIRSKADKPARPVEVAALSGKDQSAQPMADTMVASTAPAPMKKRTRLLKGIGGLEISNGAGRLRMARRMSMHLTGLGIATARLTNAESFDKQVSEIHFRPGQMAKAAKLKDSLPIRLKIRENMELTTDLRLLLGGDLLGFDSQLIEKFKK